MKGKRLDASICIDSNVRCGKFLSRKLGSVAMFGME